MTDNPFELNLAGAAGGTNPGKVRCAGLTMCVVGVFEIQFVFMCVRLCACMCGCVCMYVACVYLCVRVEVQIQEHLRFIKCANSELLSKSGNTEGSLRSRHKPILKLFIRHAGGTPKTPLHIKTATV